MILELGQAVLNVAYVRNITASMCVVFICNKVIAKYMVLMLQTTRSSSKASGFASLAALIRILL